MKKIRYSLSIKGKNEPLKVKEIKLKTKKGTNSYSVLNEKVGIVWETEDKELALKVKANKGKWYDGIGETPSHTYEELELLEVTKINIVQSVEEIQDMTMDYMMDRDINQLEIKRIMEEEIDDNYKKEEKEEIRQEIEATNVQVKERKESQKTIKMIVECKKTMYKELGQIVSRFAQKEILFEKGQQYLGYVKDDKVFVLSSKKTPEYICDLPEKAPKSDTLFDIYFNIKEVRE